LVPVVNGQPELAVGIGVAVGRANHPPAVKLVMAVNIESIGKANQYCLASGLNGDDFLAGQLFFVGFEVVKGKKHFCGYLAGNGLGYVIGGAFYLWAFGHLSDPLGVNRMLILHVAGV